MTCKLVLAVKAIIAAELAARHVAWKVGSLGAVFGTIVSFQVTEFLGGMATVFFGTFISPAMLVVGTFVVQVLRDFK